MVIYLYAFINERFYGIFYTTIILDLEIFEKGLINVWRFLPVLRRLVTSYLSFGGLPKRYLYLKLRICSLSYKFFTSTVDHNLEGREN